MRFDIVTLFPTMVRAALTGGVVSRAIDRGIVDLCLWDPRQYALNKHRTVDDRPYGGGPGMVMKVEPLRDAIRAAKSDSDLPPKTIYLSPQGRLLDQTAVKIFAQCERIILVAGRYEGIDERLIHAEIDEEWSIGDYVVSGGELAALVILDAVSRLLPGVLGHRDSAEQDSHMAGLLDYPHYTRPEIVDGLTVPHELQSGNHEVIRKWRLKQSLKRTHLRRPDLLEKLALDREQRALLDEIEHEVLAEKKLR